MEKMINDIAHRIIAGGSITEAEAIQLTQVQGTEVYDLFRAATRVKEHFVGNEVHLCSIINAKSGRCAENCAFCAQSAHHKTDAPVYPLVQEEEMLASARMAETNGSACFGIITSGTTVNGPELEQILTALRRIRKETTILPSCSLGIIDEETARKLKEAGMDTYHHNLETAASFFPQICTTHDYQDDVNTVRAVKKAGVKVCCGGIFGLGESAAQRVEMALTLKDLDVDSVPMNFLNPIEGTRLEGAANITAQECLKTIAIYRLILPGKRITVCGGREKNLRDLQSWIFFAGANGTMIGNYLTTLGRNVDTDLTMFSDLGLKTVMCAH
ncbi:biotin synthase [Citrifermentans bemidjiense Bem]|uniref:Biotin synthase n=1 Tax=Citrifermentans bemidjiense (strain ATCC BAA-1014 / DSM 16622 / JCM 12645 / Bem) TaxID=404380 RepID=BIOB_CITBB|nr:biotin synthase BioB [Citrifermentans bemidjiense]B5ECN1.1 RecName: Full=Biotin synthase [Citrifermentans bemidjiense Bem]ACH39066.1 biotin synthase [Citrifermentans bemidjiense Bem]